MLNVFILIFFIYSFLGWILEVIYSFFQKHKFINRGFLLSPICPIYGLSSLLLFFILANFKNSIFLLFILSLIICSFSEYFISAILEKLFNLRWWDYSKEKFNINGRVCLKNSIAFGILGVLVVKFITPFLLKFLFTLKNKTINFLTIFLIIILIIDLIISSYFSLKIKSKKTNRDSTIKIKNTIYSRIKNFFH